MAIKARFVRTNLTTRAWKKLVLFYGNVVGRIPKGPDRDFSGEWLDRVTALRKAHLRGIHVLLPGYGEAGPTPEIFRYDSMGERGSAQVNEPGFAHVAFAVDNVDEALEAVVAAGGCAVGDIAMPELDGVRSLRVVYARDPEGKIVELQKWS